MNGHDQGRRRLQSVAADALRRTPTRGLAAVPPMSPILKAAKVSSKSVSAWYATDGTNDSGSVSDVWEALVQDLAAKMPAPWADGAADRHDWSRVGDDLVDLVVAWLAPDEDGVSPATLPVMAAAVGAGEPIESAAGRVARALGCDDDLAVRIVLVVVGIACLPPRERVRQARRQLRALVDSALEERAPTASRWAGSGAEDSTDLVAPLSVPGDHDPVTRLRMLVRNAVEVTRQHAHERPPAVPRALADAVHAAGVEDPETAARVVWQAAQDGPGSTLARAHRALAVLELFGLPAAGLAKMQVGGLTLELPTVGDSDT